MKVVDLACGEGYGSEVLSRTAAEVIGVDANPEAFAHASAKYSSETVSFRRELVESFDEPRDAVVFLQTIEHIADPGPLLDGFARIAPVSYISTPNLLTLAPEGAEKSDNPWHVKEYRLEEYRALLEPHFSRVEVYGLSYAGKLKAHEVALSLGWDRVHKGLGLTKPFYDWFTPAISASDFRLSTNDLESALDFIAVCHA
jgi:SAM-dependent methyltransferase